MEVGCFCTSRSPSRRLSRRSTRSERPNHKDIKPANILLDAAKEWDPADRVRHRLKPGARAPRRLTLRRRSAGKLAYMAPEQTGRMNSREFARSDLYALGNSLNRCSRLPPFKRRRFDGNGCTAISPERPLTPQ